MQCCFAEIQHPTYAREYVNLRKHCHTFYRIGGGVVRMLDELGMEFEGREHSGIDDTRNIARIAIQLLKDGSALQPNDSIEGASTARLRAYRKAGFHKLQLPMYQREGGGAAAAAAPGFTGVQDRDGGWSTDGALADPELDPSPFVLFCDLDGVLADFDSGVIKMTGRHPDAMAKAQMWRAVAGCGERNGFFGSLDWMADGQHLWDAIKHAGPTILTGCPMSDRDKAAKQKRGWCARHLGPEIPVITCMSSDKRNFIVKSGQRTPKLPWVAPYSILIDDRRRNGKSWEAAGGLFVMHRNTAETLSALRDLDTKYTLGLF
jgi:hypothetical protein